MDTKYKSIYTTIKERIETGIYPVDSQIPDEISLCKEFDCSRMTMKKALDLLVDEGSLFRKRGQGSFVKQLKNPSERIMIQERDLTGLTRSNEGREVTSKIIDFHLEFANKHIASILNIEENDPIYHIERLRLVDNQPYVRELTYMSTNLIKGITLDVLKHSVYNYIENTLGYRIGSAQKTMRACISNDNDHKFLKLKDNEPVLEIEQIAYLDNGIPFEYSFSRHRYDLFEFTSFGIRH